MGISIIRRKVKDMNLTLDGNYCRADDSGFHFSAVDFWAKLHCQNLYSNKGCGDYAAMY